LQCVVAPHLSPGLCPFPDKRSAHAASQGNPSKFARDNLAPHLSALLLD
jgi:hypothetical protein